MLLFCLQVLVIGFGTVVLMLALLYFIIQLMSAFIRYFERRGQQHNQ